MKAYTRRGVTTLEVVISSGMTVFILVGAVSVFLLGMSTWFRGQARIDANGTSQIAVREISSELREAMFVSVDANGQGVTFQRPAKDGTGTYTQPEIWDNITRRIALNASGEIWLINNGVNARRLCKSVILTDPLSAGGTAAYQPFTAGSGTLTRSVTIMVVTQRSNYKSEKVTSRSRETIFLRNVPQLTQ